MRLFPAAGITGSGAKFEQCSLKFLLALSFDYFFFPIAISVFWVFLVKKRIHVSFKNLVFSQTAVD